MWMACQTHWYLRDLLSTIEGSATVRDSSWNCWSWGGATRFPRGCLCSRGSGDTRDCGRIQWGCLGWIFRASSTLHQGLLCCFCCYICLWSIGGCLRCFDVSFWWKSLSEANRSTNTCLEPLIWVLGWMYQSRRLLLCVRILAISSEVGCWYYEGLW